MTWRIDIPEYAQAWLAFKQLRARGKIMVNPPLAEQWDRIRADGWLEGVGLFGNSETRFVEMMESSPHYFRAGHDRFGADLMQGGRCVMPEKLPKMLAEDIGGSVSELFSSQDVEQAIALLNLDAGYDALRRGELAQAHESFELAAEQGNSKAQLTLGQIYLEGRGGRPQDHVLAHKWLNLAAAGLPGEGRQQAVRLREKASATLTKEGRSQAEALAREWTPRNWADFKR